MFDFFASPETISKLREVSQAKVLLIGGFNGNFGDLMQLLGVVHWHQANQPDHVVCPFVDARAISSNEELALISNLFRTEHWLVYASDEEAGQHARVIGLEPVELSVNQGQTELHVYGGGFLNRFWGDLFLGLMQQTLESVLITHYLISGQQVGPEFAERLVEHCERFKPGLVGCRDPLSVHILAQRGIKALFSGDDAFEEFQYCRSLRTPFTEPWSGPTSFGLHLRLTVDVYRTPTGEADPQREVTIVRKLDALYQTLFQRFGPTCHPVVVGSLLDARHFIQDSWAGIKRTVFTQYFPQFTGLDLVGLFIQGRLVEAISVLQRLQMFITMSYHTDLLLQMLGVPTYLLAFNRYYEQKQRGLEQDYATIEDFLTREPAEVLAKQEEYLSRHRQGRDDWLRMVGELLGVNGSVGDIASLGWGSNQREKKRLWLRLAEQEYQNDAVRIARLERQAAELEQTTESLKQRNKVLANKMNQLMAKKSELEETVESLTQQNSLLEERLKLLYQSRSWRVIQKYWRAMDSPVMSKILIPIRRVLLSLFWRGDKQ